MKGGESFHSDLISFKLRIARCGLLRTTSKHIRVHYKLTRTEIKVAKPEMKCLRE